MLTTILTVAFVPLAGTMLGAAFVFFMKKQMSSLLSRCLAGFAAGVMTAASVWSLLIPAIEQSESLDQWAWIPAFGGFWLGVLFLLALDQFVPHQHVNEDHAEGLPSHWKKNTKLMLAVTLHNVPEGMAVGAVLAGMLLDNTLIPYSAALALALGIAIQNVPEGAIISMPMRTNGVTRWKSFVYGTLSGVVEPIATFITLMFYRALSPILPWFLAFAAGAMVYVVVEELLPEMSEGSHTNLPSVIFCLGFSVMMVLDVALG